MSVIDSNRSRARLQKNALNRNKTVTRILLPGQTTQNIDENSTVSMRRASPLPSRELAVQQGGSFPDPSPSAAVLGGLTPRARPKQKYP